MKLNLLCSFCWEKMSLSLQRRNWWFDVLLSCPLYTDSRQPPTPPSRLQLATVSSAKEARAHTWKLKKESVFFTFPSSCVRLVDGRRAESTIAERRAVATCHEDVPMLVAHPSTPNSSFHFRSSCFHWSRQARISGSRCMDFSDEEEEDEKLSRWMHEARGYSSTRPLCGCWEPVW